MAADAIDAVRFLHDGHLADLIGDEEAVEIAKRFANDPRVRVINPATGFDTGETWSPTLQKAMKAAGIEMKKPSSSRGGGAEAEGGAGRVTGVLGAINVIGDIYLLWSVGVTMATGNLHQFNCAMIGVDVGGLPCDFQQPMA